ncbi:hypothetical protein C0J26_15950 [Pseudomonas baetica]|nr:hypothetical protein C0J26_15950 [Pseudomonas baetica]
MLASLVLGVTAEGRKRFLRICAIELCAWLMNLAGHTKPMWERACSRRGRQIQHFRWQSKCLREQARSHRDCV